MTGESVCKVEQLKVGTAGRFLVGETPVCLVRTGETEFRVIGDTCSHEDYSLAEGEVDLDECAIECWKHGSMFSLETGEPTTFPATRPVPVYEVEIDGDDVIVTVP